MTTIFDRLRCAFFLLLFSLPALSQEYRVGDKAISVYGPGDSWQPADRCELIRSKEIDWAQWFGYKKRLAEEAGKVDADTVRLVGKSASGRKWIDVEFYACDRAPEPGATPTPPLVIEKAKFLGIYKSAVLFEASVRAGASKEKLRELAGVFNAEWTLANDLKNYRADEALLSRAYRTGFDRVQHALESGYGAEGLAWERAVKEATRALGALGVVKNMYVDSTDQPNR